MKERQKKLKPGDEVTWNTSQGRTRGIVEKKLTRNTRIKTHKVSASKENPEYLVRSKESGKKAAHRPGALQKTGDGSKSRRGKS
jgi:uncharacterized protein YijF (DUF1287 family)